MHAYVSITDELDESQNSPFANVLLLSMRDLGFRIFPGKRIVIYVSSLLQFSSGLVIFGLLAPSRLLALTDIIVV